MEAAAVVEEEWVVVALAARHLEYHRLQTLDPVADQVLVVVRLRLQEWGRRGERCGCGIGCGA